MGEKKAQVETRVSHVENKIRRTEMNCMLRPLVHPQFPNSTPS